VFLGGVLLKIQYVSKFTSTCTMYVYVISVLYILAEYSATLRVFMENFEKISKNKISKIQFFLKIKFLKILKNFREIFFLHFFWQSTFHIQFGVCLRKFGGSRPAGLAVKGIRTNSTIRLSQIIILFQSSHLHVLCMSMSSLYYTYVYYIHHQ
jgi:hypothetical protein